MTKTKSTYTIATLSVSKETYKEIHDKLAEAGYQDQFLKSPFDGTEVIDMTGIGITLDGE